MITTAYGFALSSRADGEGVPDNVVVGHDGPVDDGDRGGLVDEGVGDDRRDHEVGLEDIALAGGRPLLEHCCYFLKPKAGKL